MPHARMRTVTSRLSRRDLLKEIAGASVSGFLRSAKSAPTRAALFAIVPPERSGITWVHNNARSEAHWLPESMCSGCAFLDYNNDGWMDIFLVNTGPSDFFHPEKPLRNALYKNNRDGTFTDVMEKAGVANPNWSTSAVWFDYDNDGKLDLFV